MSKPRDHALEKSLKETVKPVQAFRCDTCGRTSPSAQVWLAFNPTSVFKAEAIVCNRCLEKIKSALQEMYVGQSKQHREDVIADDGDNSVVDMPNDLRDICDCAFDDYLDQLEAIASL